MKKCKHSFKAEFGFNICVPASASTEINSNLPLTSVEEGLRSLFHRNSSSKIQEIHFSYYVLEG